MRNSSRNIIVASLMAMSVSASAADAPKKKWDVNNPPGESKTTLMVNKLCLICSVICMSCQ